MWKHCRPLFRSSGAWYGTLAGAFLVATLAFSWSRDEFLRWLAITDVRVPLARSCFLMLIGVPVAQCTVGMFRWSVARLAGVPDIPGSRNLWPQRLVGVFENGAFALAFALAEPKEVLTGIAAWVTFKHFGDWPRWKVEASAADADLGKRRFYVFLLANVVQVGSGALLGSALARWALAVP